MAKRVSVVIPTVDRPALLPQSLASVLAQDWVDLDVVVVFDGSPARDLVDDDRVQVVSTGETRLGGAGARNLGIELTDGTHVAFLDDDDLWEPDRLSRVMSAVDAASVVVSWSRFLGRGASQGRDLSGDVSATILSSLTPSLGAVLVERSALLEFDPSWRAVEDVDWWLRTAQVCSVTTVRHTGHLVRRHDGTRFGNGDRVRASENLALIEHHRGYFDHQPEAEAFRLRRAALYARRCGDVDASRRLLRRSMRRRPTSGAVRDYLRLGLK